MASKRDRQRRLERARAERRIARQAHVARRKRQVQAGVGAGLALVLIILGTTWLLGGFDSKPRETVASGTCTWNLKDPAADPNIKDVGYPPTTGEPHEGTETMTITTSLGPIEATLDVSRAPCTAASFKFLGEKGFFDNTSCHYLSTLLKVLECGDPGSSGAGGPAYQFADEDIPSTPVASASPSPSPSPSPSSSAAPSGPYYTKGQIVMVNTGANTNGSLFYIVYDNANTLPAAYTVVGTITTGMGTIDDVVKGGAVNDSGQAADEGKPKNTLTILKLAVAAPATPSVSPSATSSTSSSASPSSPAPQS